MIGFLNTILPMIKGIRLKQHIVEGDYVATVFDMETIDGVDHVFDRIQVVDEEIIRNTSLLLSAAAIKRHRERVTANRKLSSRLTISGRCTDPSNH